MFRIINYVLFWILASTYYQLTSADDEGNGKGQSTFVTGGDFHNNLTFAICLPSSPSSDDLFYYLSGPIGKSWIAVGFGDEMKDSFMFIVYPSHNGKNVTISARSADGNSEPSLQSNRTITSFDDSGISDGRYVAHWKCSNCREWKGGSINVNETTQKMMYAVGPNDVELSSDKGDAGLRRHDYYGRFQIDLQHAQGDPDIFHPSLKSDGASEVGKSTDDHDYGNLAHAVFMVGTFVLLFPLGAVWLRIFGSVRLHWLTQGLGVLLIFIGAGVGGYLSKQYNRSKHFNSSHQIIGFTILILIVIQASLGAAHHRAFKKTPRPTILSSIHRILGPLAISLGIVNGVIGFKFASVPRHIIGYAIVIIAVSIGVLIASFFQSRRRRRNAVFQTPAAQNFQSAYVAPEYQNDIPLAQAGAPPPYSRPMGQ